MRQLYDLLEQQAEKATHSPFIVTSDQTLSFGEVREATKKLASHFRELGLAAGDIVGLDLPPSVGVLFSLAALHEGIVAYYGVGGTQALDRETKHLFSSRPDIGSVSFPVSLVDSTFFREIEDYPTDISVVGVSLPDDLCRLVFSSGTTGDPKPISLTVSMVENRALAAGKLRIAKEQFLCILNSASSSGFHTLVSCLQDGLPYLIPGDARENLKLIHQHSVSSIKASPFQIRELFENAAQLGYSLESLKAIYSAGASVPADLVRLVEVKGHIELQNLFGSSEAGRGAERVLNSTDLGWVGLVVEGTDLQIVDENHQPVPLGEVGSIRYRRQHQAVEYYGESELTETVFHDGWFYTGDLGKLDSSGRLILEGRTSRIMNIAGVKLNPESVVQHILAKGGVKDAVAFEHKPLSGQNEFGVGLEVEANFDFNALARELKNEFGAAAPKIFFNLESLPRNSAGKPISSKVAQLYLQALQRG